MKLKIIKVIVNKLVGNPSAGLFNVERFYSYKTFKKRQQVLLLIAFGKRTNGFVTCLIDFAGKRLG